MIYDQRPPLSSYVSGLLSTGRTDFTAKEAERALGIRHGAFLDAAERLQRRKALLSPRQGFYVVVPPQFASWGAPPPAWYINSMMRHEGRAYYVGLLKDAELHGAPHQAVMEFQVVTAKRLPRTFAGRSLIVFYFRKNMEAVTTGIDDYKTDTGMMKLSSATLTALDLLRYPQATGGINNIATVLAGFRHRIDPLQLASLSLQVERPVVQRLGYLLEHLHHDTLAEPMLEALHGRGPLPWVELNRQEIRDPEFAPEPPQRDLRWRASYGVYPRSTYDSGTEHRRLGQRCTLDRPVASRAGSNHRSCVHCPDRSSARRVLEEYAGIEGKLRRFVVTETIVNVP